MNKRTILEFGTIIFLVVFPHVARLPFFLYIFFCAGLIALILRVTKRSWKEIGLAPSHSLKVMLSIGLITAIIWTVFNQFIYVPFIHFFFDVPQYTDYNFIKGNLPAFIFVLIAAWVVGGFYEELAFRGFIQSVISRNLIVSVILTSLLFGAYHWQQGIFGVVPSFLGGLYWSWLRVRYDSLWPSIFSHAIYDTIALTLIYFDGFGLIRF